MSDDPVILAERGYVPPSVTPAKDDLPDEGDKPILWMATVFCVIVAVMVSLISLITGWHWLSSLWFNYSWPSDKGNGPEALQQTIIYFLIAALFIPVVRRFIQREFHKAHADIHAKLDHIIKHHPDIPEFRSKNG